MPGGNMKKQEGLSLGIMVLTVISVLLIGIYKFYITGISGNWIFAAETKALLSELAIWFLAAFVTVFAVRDRKFCAGLLLAEAAVFCWMHEVFLPMAASALYLWVILRVGGAVRVRLDRNKLFEEYSPAAAMADVTLGSISLILLYCLMSLAGIGGIAQVRIAAFALGAFSFLPLFPGVKERKKTCDKVSAFWNDQTGKNWYTAAFFALMFTMILLQVGRMNICADYDSLHYGLRSEYILNDGDGIYENLGNINVVYTYSKGLEILLFPLSGLPSYSFFLSFQMWMTVGILFCAGEITKLFADKKYAVFCMAVLSCIPGITNMGITAKTDCATAVFQLVMLYFLLRFLQEKRAGYLAIAGNAFLMTMVLKPTSLVFSTIGAGTVFVYMAATKNWKFRVKDRFFLSWIGAISMWILVWYRTFLLTGLPVTSVFTSIWEKLGFSIKYPFRFDSLPSNGEGFGVKEALKHFLKRLYGVLLSPAGDDMAHVRIAWGTPILLIFLVLFVVVFLVRMQKPVKREKHPLYCLIAVFFTIGSISLVSLYLLWQVDGNYFILLYCLFAILAAIVLGRMESRILSGALIMLFVPVLLFNVTVTAVSNWEGSLGLSPVNLKHKGYFDHWAEAEKEMRYKGNERIWDILAEDPETRVIVYGEQPEMLMFPCNTQSYVDIAGSGGNYMVSASVDGLVEFFDYAAVDYVYLCGGYLKPGTEAWNFVVSMIEQGYLTDILYENGHGLARFTQTPAEPDDPEAVVRTFAQCYWAGDQQ